MPTLTAPLRFQPVYHSLVWGGRNMETHRTDLPAGPVGESWDLADHPRGMSVVAEGPLAGTTLRALMEQHAQDLMGPTWKGQEFPLLVKLIDANDRLSVQVHPDDELAQRLKIGPRGKTECWLFLNDGGEVYIGLKPGVTQQDFAEALATGTVEGCLNRFTARRGDFAFIPARTVHALSRGCLIYEVQQTCDVTFRAFDWNRLGLDGKPRALHREEALATIDFTAPPITELASPSWLPDQHGGQTRHLVSCDFFTVQEHRFRSLAGNTLGTPLILTGINGAATVSTPGGSTIINPHQTLVIPAAAGSWTAQTLGNEAQILVAKAQA